MNKHPDVLCAAYHTRADSYMPGEVGCWLRIYRAYASSVRHQHVAQNLQRAGWCLFAAPLTAQEMSMEAERPTHCSVIAAIIKVLESQDRVRLLAALYRHLSVCRSCRARLLCMRGLHPRSYSCEQCQADLPTFIDLELDNPAQAAATYPLLGPHLRVCWSCAQTYACTNRLLAAERSGCLAPPCLLASAAPPSASIAGRVRLTRQILALTVPQSVAMAAEQLDDDHHPPYA